MSILSFILSSEQTFELACQIKKQNNDIDMHVFSLEQKLDEKIKKSKVFNKVHKKLKDFRSHDIIFIDSMVKYREKIFQQIIEDNDKDILIVDLSPAKDKSIEWANNQIKTENINFVSAYPIINLNYKISNIESMFAEQKFLLMPSKKMSENFFKILIQIIESIEMEPYFIEAVEFDSYYAATNVIPKLISFSIMKYAEESQSWPEMSKFAKQDFNYSTIGSLTDPEELFEIINHTKEFSSHWYNQANNEISKLSEYILNKDKDLCDYLIKGWESRMRWELGVTGSTDNVSPSSNILSSGESMAGFLVSENLMQKKIDHEKSKSKDLWKYKRTK